VDTSESLTAAANLAKQVLIQLVKLRIPPNPRNYSLWYNAYQGDDPDLTRTVEQISGNVETYDDEQSRDLYRRFLGPMHDDETLNETGERIETAISQVMEALGDAGGDAADYGKKLAAVSGKLNEDTQANQVRTIVTEILSDTRRMQERTKHLEGRLEESLSEVNQLRVRLDEVKQDALTDALTGISNRKHFDNSIDEIIEEAAASREPLCLMMLDIDHFKQFNDSYGHQTGDEVLRLVARCLTDSIKGRDFAARFGGEEFVIVLPHTRLQDALIVGDQVRANVASKRIVKKTTGEKLGNITLSAGVSQYRPGESLEDLLHRADESLYSAKDSGRNRVVAEQVVAPKESLAAAS